MGRDCSRPNPHPVRVLPCDKQMKNNRTNPIVFHSAPRAGLEPATPSLHVIPCLRMGMDYIFIFGRAGQMLRYLVSTAPRLWRVPTVLPLLAE